jgi:hypothetical protein
MISLLQWGFTERQSWKGLEVVEKTFTCPLQQEQQPKRPTTSQRLEGIFRAEMEMMRAAYLLGLEGANENCCLKPGSKSSIGPEAYGGLK